MNYIRIASACPVTNVADIDYNLTNIKKCIDIALEQKSKLIVFPELSITSYTCGDLFNQEQLLSNAEIALEKLCEFSKGTDILIAVGAPLQFNYCLYNCAYIIFNGNILGIVPKSYIPNYTEFYEKRWFTEGIGLLNKIVDLHFQKNIEFGTNLLLHRGNLNLPSRYVRTYG